MKDDLYSGWKILQYWLELFFSLNCVSVDCVAIEEIHGHGSAD